MPGVFDATLDAAGIVRDLGFRLQLNTTVTAGNVHELPAVLRLVLDLQAALWSVFFLVPTGRGATVPALDAADTEEVLHWLHDVAGHVPIKATEAPHYRRIAIQRAGVDDVDAAFPVGPLRRTLRDETRLLLGDPSRGLAAEATDRRERRTWLRLHRPLRLRLPERVPADGGWLGARARVLGHLPDLATAAVPAAAGWLREGDAGVAATERVCGGSRSRAYAVTGDPLAEDPENLHVPARQVRSISRTRSVGRIGMAAQPRSRRRTYRSSSRVAWAWRCRAGGSPVRSGGSGHLGVVSGTALDVVHARRLGDGDAGGHLRRAYAHFPVPSMAARVLDRWFVPTGRAAGARHRRVPLRSRRVAKGAPGADAGRQLRRGLAREAGPCRSDRHQLPREDPAAHAARRIRRDAR